MKQLYLFSGLGADHRVFQFLDLEGFCVKFIEWVKPLPRESMEGYATRLATQIDSENPVLVGLSFGGMMAMEVGKLIKTEKIILISSAKTGREVPPYFRLAGRLKLNKVVSPGRFKIPSTLAFRVMGAETETEKALMKAILSDTDPDFFKWAIEKVVTWKNAVLHENVVHIHGKKDKLLPYRYVKADITLPDGTHLMTLKNAKEISEIIRKLV